MLIIKTIGKNESGVSLPGFGLILPMLVLITFGIIEFSTVLFDWHRASEATRRAARHVAISSPIADVTAFVRGSSITCQGGAGGTVSCNGGGAANPDVFTELMTQVQDIQPAIQSENISVVYSDSGLGDPTTPGGILPMVTVQVSNLQRPLMAIGGFMGMPENFTYPPFLTNQIGNGIGQTE